MSKEFCKMGLGLVLGLGTCLGGLGLASGAKAQCTVPPSCESLGYTMVADNCNGKKTLKCPFDTSKLYCVTEAGLANVNLGDIVFSDHTTSSPLVYVNKTPIGIVIGKTADSIIVARATEYGLSAPLSLRYPYYFNVNLTVNKENSDIGRLLWDGDYSNPNQFHMTMPLTMLDEARQAIATYDAKRLYSFFINNFFNAKTRNNTLDEFGFKALESRCEKFPADFCPPILLPSEIKVEWKRLEPSNYLYCNELQTEGTSQGDWYLPISKDLTGFQVAMINFYESTQKYYPGKDYYNFSQEIKKLLDFRNNQYGIFELDKAEVIDNTVYRGELKYWKGNADAEWQPNNAFTYQHPRRDIEVKSQGGMICITKIKM